MILDVVAPVLHESVPAQPVAVKVAVSLLQMLFLLLLITGAAGLLPVVMITAFDTPLVPHAFEQVAV